MMAKEFSITRNESGEVVLLVHGAHYDKRITIDEDGQREMIDFLCSAMGGCDLLKDEMARADRLALTTKPAPLQADPAMTMGAVGDDDRELWGIWLTIDDRWLETPEGLIRYGFSYSIACAGAHNSSMDGELAEARRIDLWAAALPTD